MQALLFEMTPRAGHEDHYFRHAAHLRPILMRHDGLIFIERFKSLARPHVILSHSLWRDEAAITRWRTDQDHRKSQMAGRYKHFEDYRIRIARVLSYHDATPVQGALPGHEASAEGGGSDDRLVTIVRSAAQRSAPEGEVFESVTQSGSFLTIGMPVRLDEARSRTARIIGEDMVISALLGRVSRDYGMYDREEAPQNLKPVEPPASGSDHCT
ncbi:MAG: antibiotic biosynthesis monooxygenase [Pseudomonadota bacterium]